MAKFVVDFMGMVMDLKEFKTMQKKIYYDIESDKMVYALVVNDGLNEIFNTRYEFKYVSEAQLDFHFTELKDKIKVVDYIVFL